jgi:hypothetical protein
MRIDFFTEERFSVSRNLAALGVLYGVFALVSQENRLPVLCPFRLLTGHKCPLCGLTTATGRLLERDFGRVARVRRMGRVSLPLRPSHTAGQDRQNQWATCWCGVGQPVDPRRELA